jgi:hypothetical protein
MRKLTQRDVEDAWAAWVAVEMAYPIDDGMAPTQKISPIAAIRMIAHTRFCSVFCDHVLQNEPERVVEITRLDVMRAISEWQRDLRDWLDDWQILPHSPAKEHYREHLAESQRYRMELICLRHLWLASQARKASSVR